MRITRLNIILLCTALYLITIGMIASLFIWAPHERNDFPIMRAVIIIFATTLLTKYFIYMVVSPWHDVIRAWYRRYHVHMHFEPRVSVIIPAWNEEVGLLNTVKSLLKSSYRNLEVVVVNDGSTDGSHAKMEQFISDYYSDSAPREIAIKYHYKENGGKGRALNYGIAVSSGDIIMSIDADCVVHPNAVAEFVEVFRDPKTMGAVGNVKIGNSNSILGTLQSLEFLFSFYFKKADSLFNTIYIVGGAAGAFRREVFDRIGMYSSKNITEDIDLSVRMQNAGMRIVYADRALVYTEGAETFSGLLKQRLRWKRGRFQTFYEHWALFFSGDQKHNALLSWVVLPMALFGDLQLFFEPFFLLFLYIYSYLTHDFSSFISGILVVASMFVVQMFDSKSKVRASLFILAPIGWLLFYITTVVEHQALIQSLMGMLSGKKIRWQRWQRTGVISKV